MSNLHDTLKRLFLVGPLLVLFSTSLAGGEVHLTDDTTVEGEILREQGQYRVLKPDGTVRVIREDRVKEVHHGGEEVFPESILEDQRHAETLNTTSNDPVPHRVSVFPFHGMVLTIPSMFDEVNRSGDSLLSFSLGSGNRDVEVDLFVREGSFDLRAAAKAFQTGYREEGTRYSETYFKDISSGSREAVQYSGTYQSGGQTYRQTDTVWLVNGERLFLLTARGVPGLVDQYGSALDFIVNRIQFFPPRETDPDFRASFRQSAREGRRLFRDGSYEEAMVRFRSALRKVPEAASLRRLHMQALMRTGATSDAIREGKFLVRTLPPHTNVLYLLGVACERDGRYKEGRIAFIRTLLLDPDHRGARKRLAELFHRSGQNVEAIHHLDYLVESRPEDLPVRLYRARLNRARGNVDGAVKDLEEILKIHPEHREARALLEEIEQN